MADINSMSPQDVARGLGGEVIADGQIKCPGPHHSPRDRSLVVKLDAGAPGGFVTHSHSGDNDIECKDYVRERLGLEAFKPNGKGNGTGRKSGNAAAQARVRKALANHDAKVSKQKTVVAVYEYRDADGTLLYIKKRFEPKDFIQCAADGTPGLKDPRRVLYRLPELIAATGVVFVTEGEADCDRLRGDLGVCAVSADSGTWDKPGLIEPLRGRDVIVLPDNDATGETRAHEAAMAAQEIAASVRVVRLAGLASKEDASDWLDKNPDADADTFVEMCLREELWTPSATVGLVPDNRNDEGVLIEDFYAYLVTHTYLFIPTRELWPGSSVDTIVRPVPIAGRKKPMPASQWLDINRAAVQMSWCPGLPLEIRDKVIGDGGWIERKGVTVINLYRPPVIKPGNAANAKRWVAHVYKVFPENAEHIMNWLAHRVQCPADKINHALVLGGVQGIGKDTILGPVKHAVGPWNFQEASPSQVLGRFNAFVKSTVLRVSEARDLGEVNKFAFYEHMKAYTAAPPDVLRCDEKHIREHSVLNVTGVIMTTNHKVGGIYLPSDDRRHYVAWSPCKLDDFEDGYWPSIWEWYEKNGGNADVVAFLHERDISKFNPKAPPPKTDAFWEIVDAGAVPEDAELMDALERIGEWDRLGKDKVTGNPILPPAVTLERVSLAANPEFSGWLTDRKNRKTMPYRFEKCGYTAVRNPTDRRDGHWLINSRRQVVYARNDQTMAQKLKAASALTGKALEPTK